MQSYDWSQFTQKIQIDATIQAIYDAWTIPANLEKWFLRRACFYGPDGVENDALSPIRTDDVYQWFWHGHGDETVEKGVVKEANGIDKLQFSFAKDSALVTVYLGQLEGKNIVMLKQENIPTDEHGKWNYNLGCQTGWAFYLTNLKSVLEGGLDLRNKDINLKGVINS